MLWFKFVVLYAFGETLGYTDHHLINIVITILVAFVIAAIRP